MNSSVEVTVIIESCEDCHYYGKPIPIAVDRYCNHPDIREKRLRDREVDISRFPPKWCPLRHGSWY